MSKTRPSEDAPLPAPAASRRVNRIAAIFAFILAGLGLIALAAIAQARTDAPAATPVAAIDDARPMMVVATRILRVGTVVGPTDLVLRPVPDGVDMGATIGSLDEALGLETRASVYEGRPVRPGELGPPTLIRRNDVVTLRFSGGGLSIQTEGRALDAGGLGERIRVMNLDSRRTVTGSVAGPQLVVMQ